MSNEFQFIEWIRHRSECKGRVVIGPGDDCAVLYPGSLPQLITSDMLMDGVDFHLNEIGPHRVGRKAMAVNLSDLAAMAGIPLFAVVSVALPRGVEHLAELIYLGLREVADRFGVSIVGGDTNTWYGPLVISVTLIGESEKPILRSGAMPGDKIFVTGQLGGSILGHHLDFTPRIHEARALRSVVDLHSMIDISDGLSQDLHHIITESSCGAVVFAEKIPVSLAAQQLSKSSGKPAIEHALTDGEDFELIFTIAQTDVEKLLKSSPVPVWKIGECIDSGYFLEYETIRQPLTPKGWVHSF